MTIIVVLLIVIVFFALSIDKNYNMKNIGTESSTIFGRKLSKYVCFDNAASTECCRSCVDDINNINNIYHAVHRGKGSKSRISTDMYEKSRETVKQYIDAPVDYQCVYTKNATESLNLLAHIMHTRYTNTQRKYVLVTEMEHHSNILSWGKYFEILFAPVLDDGTLDLVSFEKILSQLHDKIAIVSVCGCSNVTGISIPLHTVSNMVHKRGLQLCVDGSQLVPHKKVSMADDNIDYMVFSAHKIYCPYGIGCLIGKLNISECSPMLVGGGQVDIVTPTKVVWKTTEEKFEAGSQNVIGTIALDIVLTHMMTVRESVEKYETQLTSHLLSKLSEINKIKIYGTFDRDAPVVSFTIDDYDNERIADILDTEHGFATRCGCFCAQLYARKLLKLDPEYSNKDIVLIRVSLGMYNTIEEIDDFVDVLKRVLHEQHLLN